MPKIDLNLDKLKTEREEIQAFLSEPNAYSSPDFSAKNKRFTELEKIIEKGEMRENLGKILRKRVSLPTSKRVNLPNSPKWKLPKTKKNLPHLSKSFSK